MDLGVERCNLVQFPKRIFAKNCTSILKNGNRLLRISLGQFFGTFNVMLKKALIPKVLVDQIVQGPVNL